MNRLSLAITAAGVIVVAATAQTPPKPAGLDTAAIDRAIGKTGQAMAGDVYRVAFPRTDLNVTVGAVKVKAGFALGSWAAFKAAGTGAVAHGDLVLTDTEINPVISALQQHGLRLRAAFETAADTAANALSDLATKEFVSELPSAEAADIARA